MRIRGTACTVASVMGFGVHLLMASAALGQSNESFRPVVWGPSHVESNYIQYSAVFQSAGREQDRFFLNIVRSDGTWVVQNLPVGLEPGLTQIATNVRGDLFESGDTYHTTFGASYAVSAPAFNPAQAIVRVLGDPVNYLINGGACRLGLGVFVRPGDPPLQPVLFPPPPPPPSPPYKFVYRKGVPDVAQGPNECAPTSAANSLTWMEQEYPEVDIGLTTEEIRDILKDGEHMMTDPQTGTSDANMLGGKDAFTAQFDLPIETKAISGGVGNAPGLEDLYVAIEDGSDVELSIVWLDDEGKPAGGHWVTVVGMVEVEGQYGVWINDPDDGQEQTQFHWIDQRVDGTTALRGYGGAHYIDLTIAESVVAPVPTGGLFPLCGGAGVVSLVMTSLSLLLMKSRRGAGRDRRRTPSSRRGRTGYYGL